MSRLSSRAVLLLMVATGLAGRVSGQTPLGTEFTYQGQLKDGGSPANGAYDLQFKLFDDVGTQIGATLCRDNVSVTTGLFTTALDFGNQFTGIKRLLEIGVRPGGALGDCGGGVYTTLSPRQPLTAAPYALHSAAPWATSGSIISYMGGNVGIGTNAPVSPLHVTTSGTPAVFAESTAGVGTNFGVIGSSASTSGRGVLGTVGSATGSTYGVVGESQSSIGTGVRGWGKATTGQNYGVFGQTSSDMGTGVYGTALANSGTNYGITGITNSASGYAGYFLGGRNYFEGNVGVGTNDPQVKVQVTGGSNASLAGGGYLVNGPTTGTNLAIDNNEIMARNNGAASTLYLNFGGGDVEIGNTLSDVFIDGRLTIDGSQESYGLTVIGDAHFDGIFIADTTRYLSIPCHAFQQEQAPESYTFTDTSLDGGNSVSPTDYYAPVELPHLATVTGFAAEVFDNDAVENITVSMYHNDAMTGSGGPMASVSSAGTSAAVQRLSDNTITDALIHNDSDYYVVKARWKLAAVRILLYRVRITYTVYKPLP